MKILLGTLSLALILYVLISMTPFFEEIVYRQKINIETKYIAS